MSTTYTPNVTALNTAPPSQYTQASAVIAASATASAEATYQYRGRAHVAATGTVAPTATYQHRADSSVHAKAQFGSLAQGAVRTTYASAKSSTSGSVVAFVYRFVSGLAGILATGSVLAIPADAIGAADIDVTCSVTADATRIQKPKSQTLATTAVVSAEAALGCPANPTGTGSLYAEVGINGVYEAFTDNTTSCTAAVAVNPYTFTNFTQLPAGSIAVTAPCNSTASAIRTQRPRGQVLSVGVAIVADAKLTMSPGFPIYAAASVTADAILNKLGVSNPTSAATVQAHARQKFLANSSILATGAVLADVNTIFYENSNIAASASVEAHGTIVKQPVTSASATASIPPANALQLHQGQASPLAISSVVTVDENVRLAEQGQASVTATCGIFILDSQVRLAEQGEADVTATADTYLFNTPYVLVTRYVEANLTQPAATVTPAAVRVLQPVANVVTPAATVSPEATYVHNGAVNINAVCTVPIDDAQVRLAEQGVANVNATLTLTPVPTRTTFATVDYTATASVAMGNIGFVYIVRFGESDIVAAATIIADSVANADSLDPPERTFIRPPENTTFVRPAQEFTFRKLA